MTRPTDHFVKISDEDLALIEDGPDDEWDLASLREWVSDVQDIIDEGLETA